VICFCAFVYFARVVLLFLIPSFASLVNHFTVSYLNNEISGGPDVFAKKRANQLFSDWFNFHME
jgi:hypothetical protein